MKAILLFLLVAASGRPDQFNLICNGTSETTSLGRQSVEPYQATFRMDLKANKWCSGDCKSTKAFAKIGPAQLILEEKEVDTRTEKESVSMWVDRETGKYSSFWSHGRGASLIFMKETATCEPKPFGGFPEFDTKF